MTYHDQALPFKKSQEGLVTPMDLSGYDRILAERNERKQRSIVNKELEKIKTELLEIRAMCKEILNK